MYRWMSGSLSMGDMRKGAIVLGRSLFVKNVEKYHG